MESHAKATRVRLRDFSTAPMRAFHVTWAAFFLCFFAWFGIAPLMPVIRKELALTQAQIDNINIAAVAITILVRLGIGWFCDRFGPRVAYTGLLVLGSLPVMGIGLADSYESFLLFRLAIGAIGASFVITQYHTSQMFAPNCVGTANAMTAGIGNSGGGATQAAMPLVLAALMWMGFSESNGWRAAMVVPGVLMLVMGLAYFRLTKDTPRGNFSELKKVGATPSGKKNSGGAFLAACRDPRVWALGLIYGTCFGVEIQIHNIAAMYFVDHFGVGMKAAGFIGGSFGLMAIFARAFGGFSGDRWGLRWGLKGRTTCLFLFVFCEGLALMLFSQMNWLPLAVVTMVVFGMFVHMSCGATYAVIPFVNRRAIGSVAGIVGAGGNIGAVLTGFLFKGVADRPTALLMLGAVVVGASFLAMLVRFSSAAEAEVGEEMENALGVAAA